MSVYTGEAVCRQAKYFFCKGEVTGRMKGVPNNTQNAPFLAAPATTVSYSNSLLLRNTDEIVEMAKHSLRRFFLLSMC